MGSLHCRPHMAGFQRSSHSQLASCGHSAPRPLCSSSLRQAPVLSTKQQLQRPYYGAAALRSEPACSSRGRSTLSVRCAAAATDTFDLGAGDLHISKPLQSESSAACFVDRMHDVCVCGYAQRRPALHGASDTRQALCYGVPLPLVSAARSVHSPVETFSNQAVIELACCPCRLPRLDEAVQPTAVPVAIHLSARARRGVHVPHIAGE